MTLLVAAVGVAIAVLGVMGLARPARLIGWVSSFWERDRLWFAVVLRLAIGALLVVAAPECRWPELIRLLGLVTLVAAFGLIVVGNERMRALAQWWTNRTPRVIRAWSASAVAFGGLLVYAAL